MPKPVTLKQHVDRLSKEHPARAEYSKLVRDRNALLRQMKLEAERQGDSFNGVALKKLVDKVSAKPKPKAPAKKTPKAKAARKARPKKAA